MIKKPIVNLILIFLLTSLNIFDVIVTDIVVPERVSELNPLVSYFLDNYDISSVIILKLFFISIFLFNYKTIRTSILVFLNIVYGCLAISQIIFLTM